MGTTRAWRPNPWVSTGSPSGAKSRNTSWRAERSFLRRCGPDWVGLRRQQQAKGAAQSANLFDESVGQGQVAVSQEDSQFLRLLEGGGAALALLVIAQGLDAKGVG